MVQPSKPRPRHLFVIVMLCVVGLLFGLGTWQVMRLGQKEALIARMEERINAPVRALPPATEWTTLDPEEWDYRQVEFAGGFVPGHDVLVFTNLSEPQGTYGGPGYWVMTPFSLDTGGYVWINRGFVPEAQKKHFTARDTAPQGFVRLEGIARKSEMPNAFTPAADPSRHVEWVRNVDRLSQLSDPGIEPMLQLYVDLERSDGEALPQAGETTLTVPNRHLGYAITWFGLGLVTLVSLGYWLRHRRAG